MLHVRDFHGFATTNVIAAQTNKTSKKRVRLVVVTSLVPSRLEFVVVNGDQVPKRFDNLVEAVQAYNGFLV